MEHMKDEYRDAPSTTGCIFVLVIMFTVGTLTAIGLFKVVEKLAGLL